MPVSPADGQDLARQVGAIYQEAERTLLERIARAVAQGIDAPSWVTAKARALADLIAAARAVTAGLQRDSDGAISHAVGAAYERGAQAAVADLGALPEGQRAFAQAALPTARAADRLAADTQANLRPVHLRILRSTQDAYQQIVQRVSGTVLLGALTRRQAAQRALDQLANRGITGITDSRGRNWEMASYAEMAVRSATGRAAIQGHTDRLQQLGQQLVIISDAPLECPLCAPWESRVLTLSGPGGPQTLHLQHATQDGRAVTVHVAGSLEEARAAGLFHPNCRHNASAYLPGITSRPAAPPHPAGATYDDTQQQRYLERQVRMWKRRAVVAMDDDTRQRATARVRDYQARIRHLTAAKDLPRRYDRKQIGTAR